jgi:hypothetical protein
VGAGYFNVRTQKMDAALVLAEVTELHEFLETWFNGALPKTMASFSRLSTAWPPNFTLIDPRNVRHRGKALLAETYDQHGQFPGLSIQIKNAQVSCESSGVGVVTYEEWHTDPSGVEARLCSATLVPARSRSAGIMSWVHVHESKLHHQATAF